MKGLDALIDLLAPGDTVFLPGASGEIPGLSRLLGAGAFGLNIVSCALPGINEDNLAGQPDSHITCFLLPAALRQGFAEKRVRLVPIAYSAIPGYLAKALPQGTALAHVSLPDSAGRCSFGVAADFGLDAWRAAGRRIAVVNRRMPNLAGSPTIVLGEADAVVAIDSDPITSASPASNEVAGRIASLVAALIPNGAAVQTGIGTVPLAIWDALHNHRELVIRSGIIGDAAMRLHAAGALAAHGHVAGVAYGSTELYCWLAEHQWVRLAPTAETHGFAALSQLPLFHAINSALEVDLFGQANLEWQGGTIVSGVGGAPDFAAAALASAGGRSIIALPATARAGTVSRIVTRLNAPTVSLPRYLADLVVTEWGSADLRGRALDERARALIAIAHPDHRAVLDQDWCAARQRF